MRLVKVGPHRTAPDATADILQVFDRVGCLPEHKVTIGAQTEEAKTAHKRMFSIFFKDFAKLLLALQTRFRGKQLPLRIKLIKCETHKLAWLLGFRRCSCRCWLLCNHLICHDRFIPYIVMNGEHLREMPLLTLYSSLASVRC